MAIRLSKQSILNIKMASCIQLEQVEGGYIVACYILSDVAYLYGRDIIVYPTLQQARRAILRHKATASIWVIPAGHYEPIPLTFAITGYV